MVIGNLFLEAPQSYDRVFMIDHSRGLTATVSCGRFMRWCPSGTRNTKRKFATLITGFLILIIFMVNNLMPHKYLPASTRHYGTSLELYSLIDVIYSRNGSEIIDDDFLNRNVHPLPVLNKTRLEIIYQEKYSFKDDQLSFLPDKDCPGLPVSIRKQVPVYQEYAPLPLLENMGFDLKPGGTFEPPCKQEVKTAVIIPFRNRDLHLSVWLLHLHPFLQKQNLAYTVFVVNQVANSTFNKGVLMNSGFMEIAKMDKFDCFIFHDVDLLPEDDRILYTCDKSGIKHLAYALEEWNYQLLYQSLVGGVVAVTWQDYLRLNGFSNQYFGWGGEDDDFYVRISQNKLDIIRYPLAISRYTMVQHHRDKGNSVNKDRYKLLKESVDTKMHQRDGLNNLVYEVESIEKLPLFTRINITFNPDEVRNAKPKPIQFPYLKDLS